LNTPDVQQPRRDAVPLRTRGARPRPQRSDVGQHPDLGGLRPLINPPLIALALAVLFLVAMFVTVLVEGEADLASTVRSPAVSSCDPADQVESRVVSSPTTASRDHVMPKRPARAHR